jgi:predicted O-methyltransferase YrrM
MKSISRREFVRDVPISIGLISLLNNLELINLAEAPAQEPSETVKKRQAVLSRLESQRGEYGLSVPLEDGKMLSLLTYAINAKKALEIGTFIGYSAIWIGSALEETGGQLITVEIDPERVKEAKQNISQAGLENIVTCLQGDGHKVAREQQGPFDFIFLDAEKGNELDYLEAVFPKLNPGGIIVLHNAIAFKKAMEPYLTRVMNHPQLISVVISTNLKDGMCVSLRKRR